MIINSYVIGPREFLIDHKREVWPARYLKIWIFTAVTQILIISITSGGSYAMVAAGWWLGPTDLVDRVFYTKQ
jgi:hypothetical protein